MTLKKGYKFRSSKGFIYKDVKIEIGGIIEVIDIGERNIVRYLNREIVLTYDELLNCFNNFKINETLKDNMDLYDLVIIDETNGIYTIEDLQTGDIYKWSMVEMCNWFIEDFEGKLQNHSHDEETTVYFKNVISELSMVKFLSVFNGTYDESEYAKDRDLTYVFRNIDNGYLSASLYYENDMYYMEVCKFINGDLVRQENVKNKHLKQLVGVWNNYN